MTLPLRIKQDRIQSAKRVRSEAHLRWVRSHRCCVSYCQGMPIQAAHVRSGTDGGTSLKPGDDWTISLCADHHRRQHTFGESAFEKDFGIDMKALAIEFAQKSPYRAKFRRRG